MFKQSELAYIWLDLLLLNAHNKNSITPTTFVWHLGVTHNIESTFIKNSWPFYLRPPPKTNCINIFIQK
jgi:hypothetical protein